MQKMQWTTLLEKLGEEFAGLDTEDRQWLVARITAIEALQQELDGLFRKAGGVSVCADCDGECCGCGRHHLTLVNVLAYLVADELPPFPDFTKTCPYLGDAGCLLPVSRRPYNCITFFCEQLEGRLDKEQQLQLRILDQELRREYLAVAERYPAASLRGVWIALKQIGNGQILRSCSTDVVK